MMLKFFTSLKQQSATRNQIISFQCCTFVHSWRNSDVCFLYLCTYIDTAFCFNSATDGSQTKLMANFVSVTLFCLSSYVLIKWNESLLEINSKYGLDRYRIDLCRCSVVLAWDPTDPNFMVVVLIKSHKSVNWFPTDTFPQIHDDEINTKGTASLYRSW